VLLRVFRLGHQSLWIDEMFTLEAAVVGGALTPALVFESIHGPLFGVILHLWSHVAGLSEFALRLPSALLGAATIPVLAEVGRRWLSARVGVAAAWLTAGSPFLIWYAQEARNYALLVLCTGLAGLAMLALRERPRSAAVVTAGVAAWAGLVSNLSFALLAPLHLFWALTGPGSPAARIGRALAVGAIALVLLAPWMPAAARIWDWRRLDPVREAPAAEAPLRGETTFHAAAIPFALHAFAVGYTFGPSLRDLREGAPAEAVRRHLPAIAAGALLFGALGIAGVVAVARAGRLIEAALWLAVPLLLVSYAAFQNFKVFHPRYVAVAAPAFLLVIAAGLAALPARLRATAIAAVALMWGVSLAHHYFDPAYGREDYRAALAWVESHGRDGERVFAVGAEEPVFHYYRGPLSVGRVWLGFARQPERLARELDSAVNGAAGAWFVVSRTEDLDPSNDFVRALAARFPDAEEQRFAGVRVWRVPARPDPATPGGRAFF
jgi:4-amino-4-deoxy-L-arabinose transferase-like glycosyltransferase